MTWYEAVRGGGFRARWRARGKKIPGPVFPTEDEAKTWAIAKGHDIAKAFAMDDILKQWSAVRLAEKNATPEYVTEVVERIGDLCLERKWRTIGQITLAAVDQWRIATGGVGVERSLSYLLSVLRWAAQRMDAPVQPKLLTYRRPRKVRDRSSRARLTDDDYIQILERAAGKNAQVQALINYLSTYGARPKTACILRIRNIDLDQRLLRLSAKHSGTWEHELTEETCALFATIMLGRHPNDPLFLDQTKVWAQRKRARPLNRQLKGGWPLNRRGEASVMGGWYRRAFGDYLPEDRGNIYQLKYYAFARFERLKISLGTMAEFGGHADEAHLVPYLKRGARDDQRSALAKLDADNQRLAQLKIARA